MKKAPVRAFRLTVKLPEPVYAVSGSILTTGIRVSFDAPPTERVTEEFEVPALST